MEEKGTIKREFLVERQGKLFALYQGLLDLAHQQGLKSINTDIIQFGTPENDHTWLFKATVVTDRGTFTGFGDASTNNVSRAMQNCLPRFAETRSKARALRDATNVGVAALEELDADDVDAHPTPAPRPQPAPPQRPAPQPQPPTGIAPTPIRQESSGDGISDNQRKAIFAIMKSLDWTVEYLENTCQHRYQVRVSQLSKAQASEFIGTLKEMQGAR